jgi:lipooligosaccharide transport system permease protein
MNLTAPPVARVAPFTAFGTRKSLRVYERNYVAYRRIWVVLLSGFFEPVFYLFSLGVGLDHIVGSVVGPGGRAVSYAAFVAPGLLASSAMNGGVYEVTNIFWKMKYAKLYNAMLATPVGPRDVALGEMLTALARGTLYSACFVVVMLAMGLIKSWWGLALLPAAMLIGFVFSTVGSAATTYMRSWQDMELVQVCLMPLFLFSTTFYPLTTYSGPLQAVVRCTPLYHGVALERELALGAPGMATLVHIAYLLALGACGLVTTGRRMEKLLLT